MATKVTSTRNLVGTQSVAFIRAIRLTLTLAASRPNTPMNVFFDGVKVNHHCYPSTGTLGDALLSTASGSLTIIFDVPGGQFRTGTREIVVTDAPTLDAVSVNGSVYGSAKAEFASTGIANIFQETVTITQVNTFVIEQVLPPPTFGNSGGNSDPLAQSFFTYGVKGGCYLTSIDLFFNTKDENVPVQVDIRRMVNGYPDTNFPSDTRYICILPPTSVNVSTNASAATSFTFETPVYLEENKDYCFVVFSNSKNYNLFTSKLGEKSLETGRVIFEQPYSGSLFKSENNITWQAEQFEDIKFNLNIAQFSTATNGVVKMKAVSDFFGVYGTYLSTTDDSSTIRVRQTVQHGLEVNSKIWIAADAGAVYNGILAASIAGQRNVTAIIDEYTYEFAAATNASSTGQIKTGGQVREIKVDVGGSNYTSAPTVSFSGGGGTGALATAFIADGQVVRIAVTSVGSGYTSAPTVSFTGGGGSGAVAVAIIDATFSINANKPTNFVVSNIPAYTAPDGKLSAKITSTQLNYAGGNLSTYQPADVVDMAIQGRTYLNTNSVIASKYNEIDRMGGNPSTIVEYSLSTTNPNVSPLIDIGNSPSLISYNYRLRNQIGEDLTASTSTGVVNQIVLLNTGSGYNIAPTVSFIGDGTGAEASALLGSTAVSAVTVGSGGSGYTSAPTVSFSGGGGTGALATAVLAGTSIASLSITNNGSGYTSAPDIVFSGGGGGAGAAATAVLSTAGLESISVDSGGTGYSTAPTVSITGGGGTGATATATVSGGAVTSITVDTAGSGYTSAPTIEFSGGGGSGALATAVLQTRNVASITLTNGGSGYTVAPSLIFSGGGGAGAAASATLSARAVASITLTNGGSGYTSAPSVSMSGGGGTGATATASIAGRSISNIVITNPGANYSTPPEVVITRVDASTGVDAIASSTLTTFNSELSADKGTSLSRYITKKFSLETPSTGITLFSEIYSEQQSGVDWYIRTSKSGSGTVHDSLEWKILNCDKDRNLSSKRGEVFDYQFYLYDLAEFDTYDLKCVLRSSNPAKAPEVRNYRVVIVA